MWDFLCDLFRLFSSLLWRLKYGNNVCELEMMVFSSLVLPRVATWKKVNNNKIFHNIYLQHWRISICRVLIWIASLQGKRFKLIQSFRKNIISSNKKTNVRSAISLPPSSSFAVDCFYFSSFCAYPLPCSLIKGRQQEFWLLFTLIDVSSLPILLE